MIVWMPASFASCFASFSGDGVAWGETSQWEDIQINFFSEHSWLKFINIIFIQKDK